MDDDHKGMPTLKATLKERLLILPASWKHDYGEFNLLRVVAAFPAEPSLAKAKEDEDQHALASLDVEMCKRLTVNPKTGSILEALELEMKGKKRKADVLGEDTEKSKTRKLNVPSRRHSST